MCGRYESSISNDTEGLKIKARAKELNLTYSEGEIFPTNEVLCFIPINTKTDLTCMKWGIKTDKLQINARTESIKNKQIYNNIKNNRCAVIANGFYEWDKNKRKYFIKTKEKYIYLACIFSENNELLIITKEAEDNFSHIHNRVPIIMNKEEMLSYIHNKDAQIIKKELIINDVTEQIKLF